MVVEVLLSGPFGRKADRQAVVDGVGDLQITLPASGP